jgi:CRP-like cAMP-binding protein
MEKYFSVLRDCTLFAGIGKEELSRMLTCLGAKTMHFCKRECIFEEGAPSRYIGLMLSGSALIERNDFYGNRSIVGTVGVSELFCESFAAAKIDKIPVSVVASEDCEVMMIDCSRVLCTCEKTCSFHRNLIFNFAKDLASKNIDAYGKIEITSKRTTRDKLMAFLLIYAKRAGKNEFDIPFDRQQLADYLEVDRTGLSSEIGRLTREGVIISNKKHFVLLRA